VLDGDESSGFVMQIPSYHHQRFPENCQLEFERCRKCDFYPKKNGRGVHN